MEQNKGEEAKKLSCRIERIHKTDIEFLKEMQDAGKIDVAFELERILGEEFRSALLNMIEEKDWTQLQKDQILSYRFKGKNVLEWELECQKAKGYDENGHPSWYVPHTAMLDAFTWAKISYLTEEQLNN
jgi:hypothetical protein